MNTGLMTARKRRVAAAAKRLGAPAVLVTSLPDVRYLTGFTGSNAALLLTGTRATLFTDGRYTAQAQAEVDGAEVRIVESAVKVALGASRRAGNCRLRVRLRYYDCPGAWPPCRRPCRPSSASRSSFLRRVSLPTSARSRMRLSRTACAPPPLSAAVSSTKCSSTSFPGATEMEVAMALEYMARLEGAESMSFETIVAGGQRSALPHGRATIAKLPPPRLRYPRLRRSPGRLLLRHDPHRPHGSCPAAASAKLTKPSSRRKRQASPLSAPASSPRAVDEATRSVLQRAGFAEYFSHSTGHGVGIEIHESPRLGSKREGVGEAKLKPGMIVTIEPGIYMPGKFGIRIEDTVLVTATGCEIFTPTTRGLD